MGHVVVGIRDLKENNAQDVYLNRSRVSTTYEAIWRALGPVKAHHLRGFKEHVYAKFVVIIHTYNATGTGRYHGADLPSLDSIYET